MTPSLFDLNGRLALVTGSSRGLGNALARGLAQQGARVILHGRDLAQVEAQARAMAEETGASVEAVSFDVTDADAARAAVDALIAQYGTPDILVNNAGLQRRAPFNEFAPTDWDALVATNLSSLFYVSQGVTRAMGERGSGKVVNIGSVQSKLARETIAPYSATKGAVAMLTQGMAADLARFNIQVNCISPGYFKTEMNTALWQDPAFNQWVEKRTPAQRWGHFDELIGTLVYLCSDASSFVSGQNIFVDGGMTSVV
ncbi:MULTISPECIES: glucose 1-dehydrogenase [unclassified Halomonas]|uniref:glucose 1-dehydrogenase n=1 Tax=unclassified Halomonas TaxID=2609666 RepID=UPI00209E7396|nr:MULTISPECIES: glucose 1-dehydrogenase [unclassified Halomonas]MCP1314024.1 glucose 1-dehydrogenase [Halomonas sp. 707D7]MCP1328505.1 glucose 1-dehydrogenase [Halomonas sp. 707D4]